MNQFLFLIVLFVIFGVCLADQNYFIHLSDPHVDFDYAEGAPTDCLLRKLGIPCCHNSSLGIATDSGAPRYGHRYCDAPPELIEESIAQFSKIFPHPKFIIVTGDIASHNALAETSSKIAKKWDWFFTLLEKYFGDKIKIVATLGNHDVFLADQFPDNGESEVLEYLTPVMKAHRLINDNKVDEMMFAKYGFYKTHLEGTNLDFISTNTIVDLKKNAQTNTSNPDPMNQYQYVRQALSESKKQGHRVWMLSHIMPNNSEIITRGASSYSKLVDEFAPDVLQVGFFGHTHRDQFALLGKKTLSTEAKSLALLAPGMTPKAGIFTSLRAVGITNNFDIKNWQQYYVNITKANERNKVLLEQAYNLRQDFTVSEVSTKAFQDLARKILRNETLAKRYISHKTTHHARVTSCDTGCRKNAFCSVSFVMHDLYLECLHKSYDELLHL